MLTNNRSRLFMADDFAQVKIVHQWQGYPLINRHSTQAYKSPEQPGTNPCAEVEIVLRYIEQDEQTQHYAYGIKCAAQELVDVEFSDEAVELLDQEGVVVALHS